MQLTQIFPGPLTTVKVTLSVELYAKFPAASYRVARTIATSSPSATRWVPVPVLALGASRESCIEVAEPTRLATEWLDRVLPELSMHLAVRFPGA